MEINLELEDCSFIDNVFFINNLGYFVEGWAIPISSRPLLVKLSISGFFLEVREDTFYRFPRADVRTHISQKLNYEFPDYPYGFLAFFPYAEGTESLEVEWTKIYFDHRSSGTKQPIKIKYEELILKLFENLKPNQVDHTFSTLLKKFSIILHQKIIANSAPQMFNFGDYSGDSPASFIIPSYPDLGLAEIQLASFSKHLNHSNLPEVLYVLNSRYFDYDFAKYLYQVYQIPFRVLFLNDNFGYGIANNIAAMHASSPELILMNSDIVLKDSSVTNLIERRSFRDRYTLSGIKLLYPDETIQHGGLYLEKIAQQDHNGKLSFFYTGSHLSKGSIKDFFSDPISEVLGITGAFLQISKDDFFKSGMFPLEYIFGDYEDIHFCLQQKILGNKVVYRNDVSAYHLEGYSKNNLPSSYRLIQLHNRNLFNMSFYDYLEHNTFQYAHPTSDLPITI